MPIDTNTLARMLESGQYDTYVKGLLDNKYGIGQISPFAYQRVVKQADNLQRQALLNLLVSQGASGLSDTSAMDQAMQGLVSEQLGGPAVPKSSSAQLLQLLDQWRRAEDFTPEQILAQAIINDPNTMQGLLLSGMPSGYGGAFNTAMKKSLLESLDRASYAPPEEGDYLGNVARIVGGVTQQPINVAPLPPRPRSQQSIPPALTPEDLQTIISIAGVSNASNIMPTASTEHPISGYRPEDVNLAALAALAGE